MKDFLTQLLTLRWLSGRRFVIGIPYLWLLIVFLVPFLIVFRISVADVQSAADPFGSLMSFDDGLLIVRIKLANYLFIAEEIGRAHV